MIKPYSESCEQNKAPILSVISPLLSSCSTVLEIGSGTGQHAIYFAQKMPHLTWCCSDCDTQLEGINMWVADSGLENVVPAFELNVTGTPWPEMAVDAVFTANTFHIMAQQDVINLFSGVTKLLKNNGDLVVYGPFNYNGGYTSASNASFDQWLKSRDPLSGIKHFEDIVRLANDNAMQLVTDYEMPVNNRILHFKKINQ